MLEANEMKVRKIVGKNKNRQNKKPQTENPAVNDWVERRRRERDELVTKMGALRLVKIKGLYTSQKKNSRTPE